MTTTMECPGCGVNLMPNMKECPKCHYIVGSSDGGTKYLIWRNQHEVETEARIKKAAEERQREIEQELAAASSRVEINTKYMDAALSKLRDSGADGYYEYTVKTLIDEGGRTNTQKMIDTLNQMGLAG